MQIETINLSQQLPIDIKPIIGRKWVLNGENNYNFVMIKDSYDDSPTNSAIINAYVNYIYGDGLYDENIENEKLAKLNIAKHLSKADARLISQDYKLYGGFAIQVIWNIAKNTADKKPILIKYIPIYNLGLNLGDDMVVNGYWYSFDWMEKQRYKPVLYPKYTGEYKGNDVELIIFQRPSSKPFYAQPDWISALRYAQIEGELANSAYNHIQNGFQGGKLVNCNGGVPATEELRKEYKDKIIKQLTGTHNTNKIIVSFNIDADKATTVEDLPVAGLNEQYLQFGTDAENKLIVAHSAPPVLFSSDRSGGGLGNNAEEIATATAMLYRKQINPMREVILDALQPIFTKIDPSISLSFKNFDTFDGEKVTKVSLASQYEGFKISFDYDGTANTEKGKELIKKYIAEGKHVYLISARDSDVELKKFAEENGILASRVYATGSNEAKINKIKELGIQEHLDNNQAVIDGLNAIGLKGKLFN